MSNRRQLREMEKVVSRVLKTAAKYDTIGKIEFEAILHQIMQQVEKNSTATFDEIVSLMPKVIDGIPKGYGQHREEDKSMEAMIGYPYAKFLQELGILE